jgi:hypothetical protein
MATATQPPIPKVVMIPDGYRRARPEEITKPVLEFARLALQKAMPIGKQQSTIINSHINIAEEKKGAKGKVAPRTMVALTEWHYDNHPNGGKGPAFWHPGISILTLKTQPAVSSQQLAAMKRPTFPTADSGLPKSTNEFAGDAECYNDGSMG